MERYLEKYIQEDLKWRDEKRTPNFAIFNKHYANIKKIQLVKELKREKTYPDGTEIRKAQPLAVRFQVGVRKGGASLDNRITN
jgi:hypothetical protein